MRLYVKVTGILFAVIVIAHVARIFQENRDLATDPTYLALTALSAALSIWAFSSLRGPR